MTATLPSMTISKRKKTLRGAVLLREQLWKTLEVLAKSVQIPWVRKNLRACFNCILGGREQGTGNKELGIPCSLFQVLRLDIRHISREHGTVQRARGLQALNGNKYNHWMQQKGEWGVVEGGVGGFEGSCWRSHIKHVW
ncbi:unnamed protein product [Ectocarpus sp. 12 AP-2014]